MSKTIKQQIFERAFELVRNPETWTRGCCARDEKGVETNIRGDDAVSFCSFGAIIRAYVEVYGKPFNYEQEHQTTKELMDILWEQTPHGIVTFNDNAPHELVVKAWERAREKVYS